MKILVVYYSRTGNTARLAQAIATELNADIIELKETTKRSGIIGYMKAGFAAMTHKQANLLPINKKIEEYDLIILGTPVWAFTAPPPVATFINENKTKIKKLATFATMTATGHTRTIEHIQQLYQQKLTAHLAVADKHLKTTPTPETYTTLTNKIKELS